MFSGKVPRPKRYFGVKMMEQMTNDKALQDVYWSSQRSQYNESKVGVICVLLLFNPGDGVELSPGVTKDSEE